MLIMYMASYVVSTPTKYTIGYTSNMGTWDLPDMYVYPKPECHLQVGKNCSTYLILNHIIRDFQPKSNFLNSLCIVN